MSPEASFEASSGAVFLHGGVEQLTQEFLASPRRQGRERSQQLVLLGRQGLRVVAHPVKPEGGEMHAHLDVSRKRFPDVLLSVQAPRHIAGLTPDARGERAAPTPARKTVRDELKQSLTSEFVNFHYKRRGYMTFRALAHLMIRGAHASS